jgi:MarR family transcriptional regulator, 2-MHQ and catechol-resistance regulon repressor
MSSKIKTEGLGLERPEGWDELYLPTVKALIAAGENLVDELRRISGRQGLSSKPMAIAVWNLFQSPRITAGDLARRCGCDAGNLSSLLDRLEEEGLVDRVSCNSDRRVRYVHLTPKGRKVGAEVQREYKKSSFYRELSRLTPKERETFTAVLTRIAAAAND